MVLPQARFKSSLCMARNAQSDQMTVSIIICTRNRANSLRSTLLSIGRAIVPQQWHIELLVVDNGSTDSTPEVVREVRLTNVDLRHISEPTVGQSYARNAGLMQTSGEIILFTDDDVRVPSYWIEGMCRPFLENAVDAVAGGVVFPSDIAAALSRPPFFSRRSWFASTESLDRDSPNRMVGANMAFHRRVLERVPKFDVELGPGALGFADETLFSEQLLAAGYRLVGALDDAVEHHFDVSRLTTENILDLARKMGRSNAFKYYHWEHKELRLVVPKLLLCRLFRVLIKCHKLGGQGLGSYCLEKAIQSEKKLAFYNEFIVQRRRPRKYSIHRGSVT